MKIQLDFVQFDDDIKGPGPNHDGAGGHHRGSHFVSVRADAAARADSEKRGRDHTPKNNVVELVHDTDSGAVVLTRPGASMRPVVRVPWARVKYAEEMDLEKATALGRRRSDFGRMPELSR